MAQDTFVLVAAGNFDSPHLCCEISVVQQHLWQLPLQLILVRQTAVLLAKGRNKHHLSSILFGHVMVLIIE